MNDAPQFDVVVPVYNEGAMIGRVLGELTEFAKTNPGFTFLVVDDGSTDDTADKVETYCREHPASPVTLLRLEANRGKGAAVHEGIARCTAPLVGFMDGDLAYSPDHLLALRKGLESHHVVIGSRDGLRDRSNISLLRHVLGSGFNSLVRRILSLPLRDTQAGLKAFRTLAARRIFPLQRIGGWAFDAEILFISQHLGYSIGEIEAVVSAEHRAIPSNLSLIRDPLRMLLDVTRVRLSGMVGQYGRRRRARTGLASAPAIRSGGAMSS